METGGFKGRTRIVDRAELLRADRHAASDSPPSAIVAEYGMTELTSQYYDDVRVPAALPAARAEKSPRRGCERASSDPTARTLPDGTVGALVHVDLANRASCVAISTEDLGVRFGDSGGNGRPGLVLIGRESGAALRGCSLDAETLQRARLLHGLLVYVGPADGVGPPLGVGPGLGVGVAGEYGPTSTVEPAAFASTVTLRPDAPGRKMRSLGY